MSHIIRWRLILVGYSALSILALFDNVRGPLFPRLLMEFDLSNTKGALFFSLASASAIAGSFLAGLLLAKWNLKPTTLIGFALMVAGPLLIGFAPHFSLILVGACLWGVAFGMVSVVQNLWVNEGSPEKYRRRLLTGLHSMYGAASVLAPLAAGLSFYFEISWRMIFIVIGLLPLLALFSFVGQKPVHIHIPQTKPESTSLALTCFAVVVGFYVAAELLLTTRMSLYLVQTQDFSESRASVYLSLFFAALFLGRILFSLLPIKTSSIKVLLLSLGSSLAVVVFGLLGPAAALVVAALFMAPFFPVAIDYIMSFYPGEGSRAISFIMGVSSIVVVVMHMLIGYVTDLYGIGTALFVDALLLLLSAIGISLFHLIVVRPKEGLDCQVG